MKTYLRYGLFAAALSVAAFAADPAASTTPTTTAPVPGDQPVAGPHAQMRAHARRAVIAEQLGLTDAQKAQMKALRQQSAGIIKGIRANPSLTPDQQHEQIAAQRQAARDQFKALLTPDQQAKLAQLTSHPRRMHALVEHRVRMASLAEKLGLSDVQKTQLKQIRQSARASIQPIRENASLTPEQKTAQIHDILKAARTQMRGVLTPDQQQKLDDLRERALDHMLRLG